MMDAQLAVAEDWNGNPTHFLTRSLERWIGTMGGAEINQAFGFVVSLATSPGEYDLDELWEHEGEDAGRFFLRLWPEPNGHFGLELGRAVEKLEAIDEQLPSAIWQHFAGALRALGLVVWDHEYGLEQEGWGWWGDWFDEYEEERDGEEDDGEPHLMRPSKLVPASLQRPRVTDRDARALLRKVGDISWAGDLLAGALEIAEMSRSVKTGFEELTTREKSSFDDVMGQFPSLVTWMRDGDGLSHMWDMEGDSLWNGGGPYEPASCWAFEPTVAGVNHAFDRLSASCAVLRKAARLIQLLRHPEGLPLIVTLGAGGGA